MDELERTTEELEEALHTIDVLIDKIGKIIIKIAGDNDEFICTRCLRTAKDLFRLMKRYGDENCDSIREQYRQITGRDIYE